MKRISSHMQGTDSAFFLREQESRLRKVNNQLATRRRIQQLRDDPLAAGHSVRYKSSLARLDRFERNTKTLRDQYQIAEGFMTSALNVVQRLREMAVAGANGTYTPDDLKKMASEADELLQELVHNANAVSADGVRVFSGTKVFTEPFETVMGNVEGLGSEVITQVRYHGSLDPKNVEIDEHSYVGTHQAGSRVFWAERQILLSSVDARAYVLQQDARVTVDGVSIPLVAGDNVYAIISKINDSGAAVRAYLDPVTNGLNMETSDARQLWLQDEDEANVFASLGLITEGQRPPYNVSAGARVSGGSIFDMAIAVRNALLAGDQESLGGKILGSADGAVDNLSLRLAETGARYARAQATLARFNSHIPNVVAAESRESDIDLTQAITDLKMFEYTHQATLSTVGSLYKHTLLDYLR